MKSWLNETIKLQQLLIDKIEREKELLEQRDNSFFNKSLETQKNMVLDSLYETVLLTTLEIFI